MVRGLYAQASDWVTWQCAPEDVTLMRLDIVRDFRGVADAKRLLTGLAGHRVPRVKTTAYSNAGESDVQTLTRFTDRWTARLYDRSEAYAEKSRSHHGEVAVSYGHLAQREIGKVRYELELRSRFLAECGLDRVAHLSDEAVAGLAADHFRKSGFDRVVAMGLSGVREAALRRKAEGAYNRFPAMLGQLCIEALSLPQAASPPTRRKHLNAAHQLGLNMADLLGQPAERRFLDFRLGGVVSQVAAQ